jgi:hypothetical protein
VSDEFIREVDEDIRQRQINNLWKKYGKFGNRHCLWYRGNSLRVEPFIHQH